MGEYYGLKAPSQIVSGESVFSLAHHGHIHCKSIIADEMGLGKTVQAIGAAELLRKSGLVSSVFIVCPTSLKYQWQKEIERFTDSSAVVIEGNPVTRAQMYKSDAFYKIVSFHTMNRDVCMKGELYAECVIMDEVQRLKNLNTQIARSARHIHSDYSIILSGTLLENKLEDLYSVMQLVDQYCLGPYYKFIEETTVRDETGKVLSYRNLNMVSEKIRSRLIRRGEAVDEGFQCCRLCGCGGEVCYTQGDAWRCRPQCADCL